MLKHIEITWTDGIKTIEAYSPKMLPTAEAFFKVIKTMSFFEAEKPVSYTEID